MKTIETFKNTTALHAKDRAAWRSWLAKNRTKESAIWLILFHKNSETSCINYNDAVEEALCFGWIDSVKYKRDLESAYQMFTPRKPKSIWSKLNKERVDRLTDAGLITSAGQKLIDLAKQTGTWDALNEIDNEIIPEDLEAALKKNKVAKSNFEAFSSSAKKVILYWIKSAKRPDTRANRIVETFNAAAENKKVYPSSK
jgi:uncharacterized protein YdeI (YjbR/CyaY-like superfamily)